MTLQTSIPMWFGRLWSVVYDPGGNCIHIKIYLYFKLVSSINLNQHTVTVIIIIFFFHCKG